MLFDIFGCTRRMQTVHLLAKNNQMSSLRAWSASKNEQHTAFGASSKRPTLNCSRNARSRATLNVCAVRSVLLFLYALNVCRLFI